MSVTRNELSESPQTGSWSAPNLGRLIDPRSVAIIGASDRDGSLGARTVSNLLDHSDYHGRVHLINRSKREIHGHRCHISILDVDDDPDVALLVVPASQTLNVLAECAQRGVGYAVVFTSGFGEMGAEGAAAEEQMLTIGRQSGMRIYGPNSPGLCNLNRRVGLMFSPSYQYDQNPGPIGLATQGGGIGRAFLQAMERGVGVGLWASTGNEVDLTVADFIEYMADADDIEVIATAMEGIKDGPRFLRAALRAAERGKPVVALKVGRSEYGARAVASHTGSLSGAAEVNSAAMRQVGVVEVDDLDELIDTAAFFARKRPNGGGRVAVYGFSGGGCAMAADAVGAAGLTLAEFAPETITRLLETLPNYAAVQNPVDATSDILTRPEIGESSLQAVTEDPSVDVVLYPFPCDYAELTKTIAVSIAAVQEKTDTPILPVWMSDRLGEGYKALVDGGLVPVRSISKATKVVTRWAWRGRWQRDSEWQPLAVGTPSTGITLTEPEAKALAAAAGIRVPDGELVHDVEGAVAAAERLGYPVVLKVVSASITHKSEIRGVRPGLVDAAAVRVGYRQMLSVVTERAPRATIDGFLVEAQAPDGIDVLVGVSADPVFGHVLTYGAGGVLTELLGDVARRILPVSPKAAAELIEEIRSAPLLHGYRGAPSADTDALVELIVAVSRFVETNAGAISEFELNPVRVLPAGHGVIALDAVLVIDSVTKLVKKVDSDDHH